MKRVKKKYQTPVIHSIELGPISPVTASTPAPMRSDSHAPTRLNVIRNMTAIIPRKHGIAVYFPVSSLSIFILRRCSLLS